MDYHKLSTNQLLMILISLHKRLSCMMISADLESPLSIYKSLIYVQVG